MQRAASLGLRPPGALSLEPAEDEDVNRKLDAFPEQTPPNATVNINNVPSIDLILEPPTDEDIVIVGTPLEPTLPW